MISNSCRSSVPADKEPCRNCKTHSSRPFQVSEPFCRIHIRKKTGRKIPASVLLFDIRIPDRLWLMLFECSWLIGLELIIPSPRMIGTQAREGRTTQFLTLNPLNHSATAHHSIRHVRISDLLLAAQPASTFVIKCHWALLVIDHAFDIKILHTCNQCLR